MKAPSPSVLRARAKAVRGAWSDPVALDGPLPEADLVLRAWYRTRHFYGGDRPARVDQFVFAPDGDVTALAVRLEVYDLEEDWSVVLVWSQDASSAVLAGVPAERFDALVEGAGEAVRFAPFAAEVVLGHG